MIYESYYTSPIGLLQIQADDVALLKVSFINNDMPSSNCVANNITQLTRAQLKAYFDGERKVFELSLKPQGTPFQQKVWSLLHQTTFGNTSSYLQQARLLGDEKAIRAMASANGKNPIGIIIPCHRIIGSSGKLVGYAGELWRKQWLLEHEAKLSGKLNILF
jgi:methylated-DNA-[protein]-cysteine S-methyltransferase